MKRFLLALLLAATPAFGGDRVLINPDVSGDLKLKANVGGTPADSIVITGSTGAVLVGPGITNVFRTTEAGADVTTNTFAVGSEAVTTGTGKVSFGTSATAAALNFTILNSNAHWIRTAEIINTSTSTAGSETGSFDFFTKPAAGAAVSALNLSTAGLVTVGAASGTQTHVINGTVNIVGNAQTSKLQIRSLEASAATIYDYSLNSFSSSLGTTRESSTNGGWDLRFDTRSSSNQLTIVGTPAGTGTGTGGNQVFLMNSTGNFEIGLAGSTVVTNLLNASIISQKAASGNASDYRFFGNGASTYVGFIGTAGSSDSLIASQSVNDLQIVAAAGQIDFSTNGGTTLHAKLDTAGLLTTTGGVTSSTLAATSSLMRVTGSAGAVIGSIEKTGDGTAELILGNNVGAGGTDKWWRMGVTASAASGFDISTVQDNNGSSPVNLLTISRAGVATFSARLVSSTSAAGTNASTISNTSTATSDGLIVSINATSGTLASSAVIQGLQNGAEKFSVRGDGTVKINAGTNTVFRCATAGTLPAGALTITSGSCGSTADTGLRVP